MVTSNNTRLLTQIANSYSVCQVLITDNSTIDTTGHEPDGRFETALRVIEVIRRICFLTDSLTAARSTTHSSRSN